VGWGSAGSLASSASSEYLSSELNKLLAFIKVQAYVLVSFALSTGSEYLVN
jgi:hypothetical protein